MADRLAQVEAPHPESAFLARSPEVGQVLMACDFALVVWDLPSGVVQLANQAAADLHGVALEGLIGRPLIEIFGPREAVESAVAALTSGAVDGLRAKRWIRRPGGDPVPAVVWSRTIELDGSRSGVTLCVPAAEVAGLGRDPSAPWRDLAPVAIGTADRNWRIHTVSADVREILGDDPRDWVGSSMIDLIRTDDAHALVEAGVESWISPVSRRHVRFRGRDGAWVEVCLLLAPLGDDHSGRIAFALIGAPAPIAGAPSDRVAELELRLRRIGAEVRAAGVLDHVEGLPAASDHPQLGELTSRQWEILSRLLRGDRVATIAAALYLSQSTVRNHLSAIFRKFGVHSQPELLDLLRPPLQVVAC